MNGPLEGVRVVDLSAVLSGPAATRLLADQGADVIKVESLAGDIVRLMGPGIDGLTSAFLSANRGKRSLAVDLKSDSGREIVRRLCKTADVFVQNFRPGAIERMGFGYDVVSTIKPDVIYVSISGFGERGPYSHKRVYDPVIQALSGLADIQGDAEEGRPRMVRTVIPDKTTALTAAQAVCAALFARERTGKGQHIRLAMLDVMIAYLWPEGMNGLTLVGAEANVRTGQLSQDLIFKTTDGYITTGAVSDSEWEGMCRALERPEWREDKRFNSAGARVKYAKERIAAMAEVLTTRSSAEWLKRLDENSVPCAPVLTRPQVIEQEQIKVNEMLYEYDHPGLGRVRQPRGAARFSGYPPLTDAKAPKLGQHSAEVLAQVGYSDDEIRMFAEQGVVGGLA
ncbi:MAG: CaiB/BaiF CoA transferase family protein [Candidatus Binatia bacterium]